MHQPKIGMHIPILTGDEGRKPLAERRENSTDKHVEIKDEDKYSSGFHTEGGCPVISPQNSQGYYILYHIQKQICSYVGIGSLQKNLI